MAERPKFQFRMRDLLWAVSLIGASLGLALAGMRNFNSNSVFAVFAFGCAGACLATGIGCIFRKPFAGAKLGVAAVAGVFGFVVGIVVTSVLFPSVGFHNSAIELVGGTLGAVLFNLGCRSLLGGPPRAL